MKAVSIKEIFKNSQDYIEKDIAVQGWIKTVRDSNKFAFIELNDGTFLKYSDSIGIK